MIRIICLILTLQFAVACEDHDGRMMADKPIVPYSLPRLNTKPEAFRDCADMQAWRDRKWDEWNRTNDAYNRWIGSGGPIEIMPGTTLATTSSESTSTNNQIAGIDESDRAKFLDGQIYFVRKVFDGTPSSYRVEILSAEDLASVQAIDLPSDQRPHLFVFDQTLAVITDVSNAKRQRTNVLLFTKENGRFELAKTFALQGSYKDARLSEGNIFLVTNAWLGGAETDVRGLSTPCGQILQSPLGDYSFDLTEIHAISIFNRSIESRGIVGRTDAMYITAEDIYLFSSGYVWFGWDPRLTSDTIFGKSTVARFMLAKSDFAGVAGLDGWVRNQFSFGQSKDGRSLFVATTENRAVASNRIWTLRNENDGLATVASTAEFGLGENIRSVRFDGDRAYVVTFLRTDPLFTFDLSDPRRVRMLSHLSVPGFSAYLHPVEDGDLFGAGYSAAADGTQTGLQFSLFHSAPSGYMQSFFRLETGTRYSRVDAANDHHAFYYSKSQDVAALPLRIFGAQDTLDFSGVLLLNLRDGISVAAKWTHRDLIPAECRLELESSIWRGNAAESFDIQRVFEIPSGILTLSPFGAKVYRSSPPWDEIAARKFNTTNVGPKPCLNTY